MRAILALCALLFAAPVVAQTASLPNWSPNVMNSGVPGTTAPLFFWNAPAGFDGNSTLRIDRHISSGSGTPGYTYKALWALGSTSANNAGYEWTITGEQHNQSLASTGSQNVAVNGTIWRDPNGVGPTGPSWGLNGNCVDTTGEQPPTAACIGAEIDVGGAIGPDPNRQRVVIHAAGGGQPGSHVGYGVMVSPTQGTTIDRAFSTANVGGQFGIGLDLAGASFSGAAILMGSEQWLGLDGKADGTFGHFIGMHAGKVIIMTPFGPVFQLADDGGVYLGRVIEQIPHVPTSATSPCETGEHAWDASYEYRCIAPNRWRRAALTDW